MNSSSGGPTVRIRQIAVGVAIVSILSASAAPSSRGSGALQDTQGLSAGPITAAELSTFARADFFKAFQSLSDRARVLIVVEGAPLSFTLDAKSLKDLQSTLASGTSLPLPDAVAKFAEAFDYESEQVDAQTFLLRKCYTDPNDLPCVSYGEIVRDLKSVLELVDTFAPAEPPTDSVTATFAPRRLFDSLSAEQKERAQTGLTIRQFNSEQTKLALTALECVVLEQRLANIRALVSHVFPVLGNNDTVFQWVTALLPGKATQRFFGFEGRFGTHGANVVIPLQSPFRAIGVGGYRYIQVAGQSSAGSTSTSPVMLRANNPFDSRTSQGPPAVLTKDPKDTFDVDRAVPTDLDRRLIAISRPGETMALHEAA